jgi:hypothetical protein
MKHYCTTPAIALLLLAGSAFAGESIEGEYSTVTESQCNFTLTLKLSGTGYFTETCRREDGSHIDDTDKKKISWKVHNNIVTVTGLGKTEEFKIHTSLSCEGFGKAGSRFGITGYGGNEFWKLPITCK